MINRNPRVVGTPGGERGDGIEGRQGAQRYNDALFLKLGGTYIRCASSYFLYL